MNMNTISNDNVLMALKQLEKIASATIEYYKNNKDTMYNDIMYADTLASYKELTRGLNMQELNKYLK